MNEPTPPPHTHHIHECQGWYDREIGEERTVYPLSRAVRTTVENEGPSAEPVENSLKM
jgi:hypothetical protein